MKKMTLFVELTDVILEETKHRRWTHDETDSFRLEIIRLLNRKFEEIEVRFRSDETPQLGVKFTLDLLRDELKDPFPKPAEYRM